LLSYAANAQAFAPRMRLIDIRDGTSSTIGFAEHYSICNNVQFTWALGERVAFFPPPGVTMLRAGTFADPNPKLNDVVPINTGAETIGSIKGLTFQVQPTISECDPRIAQTPHPALLVTMCDGSGRTLSPTIREAIFWGAVTPSGGEALGGEW